MNLPMTGMADDCKDLPSTTSSEDTFLPPVLGLSVRNGRPLQYIVSTRYRTYLILPLLLTVWMTHRPKGLECDSTPGHY
jgi:hypothetical protein